VKFAFWASFALALLLPSPANSQTSAATDQSLERMRSIVREAEDLQASELQGVLDKLSPLVEELAELHAKGALNAETARVYQDALLLKIRTQIKLLVPDSEITEAFRTLLVLNPATEGALFNPREKLLYDKIRSAETGRLVLQVEPAGASLIYLGADLGAAPANVPLIAGTYRLQLRKPGYLDEEFDVAIKPSEIFMMSRTMRRRSAEVPLTVNATAASILLGGKPVGETRKYADWIASLPEEKRKEYESIIRAWDVDTATSTFHLIAEAAVGEPLALEFRAPCYESKTITLQIEAQEVDWNHPRILRPELRRIELKKDTGFLDISSTPAGAEIYIDGALQGKTPLGADICSGAHRIQVVHRWGQYVREVIVRRGQIAKVTGDLKPALAFLGVYSISGEGGAWTPLVAETDALARKLVLEGTAFGDPQISQEEISALRKKGTLPLEALAPAATSASANTEKLVREIATAAGRANLILFGLKSSGQFLFQLYNTLHSSPETILLPRLDPGALGFLITQLNRAEKATSRLQTSDTGLTLVDSATGPVILKASGTRPGLAPGATIKSVDTKALTAREIEIYLESKMPGGQITLEIAMPKGAFAPAPVTLTAAAAEYPWSAPDGFTNAVMAVLYSAAELSPDPARSGLASLSLARAFMLRREWKSALDLLAKIRLGSGDWGVCAGTVLYYQGRCHEELGNRAEAEECYRRAGEYANATLGRPGGPSVPALAERRIQFLKK
jgi:hypothetical protein